MRKALNYDIFIAMVADWIREYLLINKQNLLNILAKYEQKKEKTLAAATINVRNIEIDYSYDCDSSSDILSDNDYNDVEAISSKKLQHQEKKRIILLLIDDFYNNRARFAKVEETLDVFNVCYHYMIMETICENAGSTKYEKPARHS